MVQNDEDQEVAEKITQVEGKVAPQGPEAEVKAAVPRKLISAATLIEAVKQVQEFRKNVIKNPHAKEAIRLQVHNLALAGLAAIEVVPVIEKVNDLTKILAIAQKAAKLGKEKGFFVRLYKNVPSGLMTIIEAADLARVPGAAVIPEFLQSTVNQFKFYKEGFLFGKDLFNDASARFRKFIQPSVEIQAAKLQFAPKMA